MAKKNNTITTFRLQAPILNKCNKRRKQSSAYENTADEYLTVVKTSN